MIVRNSMQNVQERFKEPKKTFFLQIKSIKIV